MKPVLYRRALTVLVALMLLLPWIALGADNPEAMETAPGDAPQNIRVLLTRLGASSGWI